MGWLQKIRPLLFVLGGLVVIGSLLGARLLRHGGDGDGAAGDSPAKPAPASNKEGSGPIFIGYADSNPSPIGFGLPPVLQSGEIVKVFVQPGQEVKVREYRLFGGKLVIGDPLYKFNSQMLDAKLVDARKGVEVARANLRKARAMQAQHKTSIDTQKLKLDVALDREKRTLDGYNLYKQNFILGLPKDTTPERIKELLANDPKLFELETGYRAAVLEHRAETLALHALEIADVGAAVAIAEAEVNRCEALVDEAGTAVDLCTVRTKMSGTIERINYGPGDVIGISTRRPAVILVPAGPRIVRAEIEAEFAHRVGRDSIGKQVTIYDNTDPKITYKGKVDRIGDTFLPKRSTGDVMVANETRVIEAVIVVENANPKGQPPLRVGQKVRVNFGK